MKIKALSAICLLVLLNSVSSLAASISWNGKYRIEGHDVRGYDLDGGEKNYLLHHLSLSPKIIVKDNIIVRARFDVFNNKNYGATANQVGAFLGKPANAESSTSASFDDSNVISQSMSLESIAATQLYLTWLMPNGAFIAGRAPKHFGLGLSHNAGTGDFDHWFDSHDVVGFKIFAGNHTITPYYGKKLEGQNVDSLNGFDVNEIILHYQYSNPDSDLNLGVYYEKTNSSDKIDDSGTVFGGTPTTAYKPELMSVYLKQKYALYDLELEAGFLSGETGVLKSGNKVDFEASGFLANFSFDFAGDFRMDARLGYASGDNPNTANWEGFLFDRNIDVGLLLFNHRLGSSSLDLMGSSVGGSNVTGVDNEYIGNTTFLAPKVSWKSGDKWKYDVGLVWATLNEAPATGIDKALGTEIDFGVSYYPNDSTHVRFEAGYLLTGSAFEGNASNPANNAYIINGKAAISF
jgi:hypothetical protein